MVSASTPPSPATPPRTTGGPAPLARGTIARYAAGSLGTGGFATLPGLVLVYYLTDTLGVTAALAGLIVTLAKVWDVLIDPVIGGLSDRALARTGTRRRSMLIGAVTLPVAFALTFAVVPGLAPGLSALWVFVAFLAAATAFSLFQVPYIALPAEIAHGYDDRTRLLTWRVVVLTLAILLFGAGGPELRGLFPDNPNLGYLVMAVIAGLVLAVGLLIGSSTAPRGLHAATLPTRTTLAAFYRDGVTTLRASQPFRALLLTFMLQGLATGIMLAGAQYVATWVLRDEGGVTPLFLALIAPALLVAPLWAKLSGAIGKERAFVIASAMFAVAALALTAMLWLPGWWILAPVALAGAAYAGMQSLPMAMLPDVIRHDASRRGDGRAGAFGGVWTAGETTGMAFGATVLTIVLTLTGYLESTAGVSIEQPASAVAGIGIAFSIVPAILMGISILVFGRYRLRKADLEPEAAA